MGIPRIQDNGRSVTIDLHGLRVEEAVRWTERVLNEARRRGRSTARVIHGSSTSSPFQSRRTIKQALYEWLENGGGRRTTSGVWKHESFFIVGFSISGRPDLRPIRAIDM